MLWLNNSEFLVAPVSLLSIDDAFRFLDELLTLVKASTRNNSNCNYKMIGWQISIYFLRIAPHRTPIRNPLHLE